MKNNTHEIVRTIAIICIPIALFFGISAFDVDYVTEVIQEEGKRDNIGYIDCMKDGTGPWHKCNGMDIRCFTERGGEQLTCPTFENTKL